MAKVYYFMEADKALFNLYVKNSFYCYITTEIMTLIPHTLE